MIRPRPPHYPVSSESQRRSAYASNHSVLADASNGLCHFAAASPLISPRDGRHGPATLPVQQQPARSQMPLRYAHPLQRAETCSSHVSQKENLRDGTLVGKSEHMLRRKTPNGILNAAYDGTSVEQMERPHAMKHILLPVIEHHSKTHVRKQQCQQNVQQQTQTANLSPQPPMLQFDSSFVGIKSYGGTWENEFQFGSDQITPSWNIVQSRLPQMDSMLNQIPDQSTQLHYRQSGNHPFAFTPSAFQLSFGPTASNDTGPYGPYWPNGTFVPYRPAALRDMRFYPQYSQDWTAHSVHNGHHPQHPHWYSVQQQQPNIPVSFVTQHPYLTPALDDMNLLQPPADFHPSAALYGEAFGQQNHCFHSEDANSTYARNNSGLGVPSAQPANLPRREECIPTLSYDHITPATRSCNPALLPLAEYGPGSENAQTRERVFSWAHSVYIDLLKYLHGVRRRNHQGRHGATHHVSGPNIYPRPPRQPSCDFPDPFTLHRSTVDHAERSQTCLHSDVPLSASNSNDRNVLSRAHPWRSLENSMESPRMTPSSSRLRENGPTLLAHRLSATCPSQGFGLVSAETIQTHHYVGVGQDINYVATATSALKSLTALCGTAGWKWVDGMLLGGCLAYALGDYQKAAEWYSKILAIDSSHVEAMSNLAATLLATSRKTEAETHWRRAVSLRPSYFEAVEHLIGLLCGESRAKEAIGIIEHVQRSLLYQRKERVSIFDRRSERSNSVEQQSPSLSDVSDKFVFDYEAEFDRAPGKDNGERTGSRHPGFGSSGYAVAGAENGRMLQLIHAKGNMLYAMGDNTGAAKAFEEAVMVGVGRQFEGIDGLIKRIIEVVSIRSTALSSLRSSPTTDPILLTPTQALNTAELCFAPHGDLPGLTGISSHGQARKAVISTTSNSLLSLAKIFQDGMASSVPRSSTPKGNFGVREILALYYLSLSLQPSPSTANNVGILLASVQQPAAHRSIPIDPKVLGMFPGVTPGSGIHLALQYYNYGLNLDKKHAHLYTNFGSLLKDIGQLNWAIQMYEHAVQCDPIFDIALANLANAVKDTGRIADAISFYRRAVNASPNFAEAVCGLANALNSVCGWQGRGGIATGHGMYDRWHVGEDNMLKDARMPGAQSSGWIKRVVDLVEKQLADGEDWGCGIMNANFMESMLQFLPVVRNGAATLEDQKSSLKSVLKSWAGQKWEGVRLVRLVERIIKLLTWQWYQDKWITPKERCLSAYKRPQLPSGITIPAAPTVLPFHTFTCPMSAKQIRHISQRNGLRISCSTLKAPWLSATVHAPPAPPHPMLKVGYVSSDFNNHPLAHLMQSIFGMHDRKRVEAFCYATTAGDNSSHRKQIEDEAPHFHDVATWSAERVVNQIVEDGIHILINLNGYTRGARNEIFAARPAPIQMSFMGFAGTLGAEWCDYLLADDTAIPSDTLRPLRNNIDIDDHIQEAKSSADNEEWVYGENVIFCRDTFFCCDHRQSAPDATEQQLDWRDEQQRRWDMRKNIFPSLSDDAIILGNFNQLYKIEPTTFRTWLRILAGIPKAVLWLLRFPDLGEQYLKQTAEKWAGAEVASRVIFTDVAPKHMHISRARVCDLFLDTPECNAHTTAADVLWSGTPLLTFPRYKYKMCSRMAASILKGALPKTLEGARAQQELIAENEDDYETKAIALGIGLSYRGHQPIGRLGELRKMLYEARWSSALFDTKRWVRDLEDAYEIAWDRWVKGIGGDIRLEN